MRISRVAERYAQALFELAVEEQQVEAVYADAVELASVCKENKIFVLVLKSPIISEEKKEKILNDLFGKLFNPMTLQFLLILVRKNREFFIPEIAQKLIDFYKEYKHILSVNLTMAVSPSEDIQHKVEEIITDYTHWKVDLVNEVDSSIIGGFILNWSDMQYDASIRYQIERLRRGSASVNLYKKGF